MAGNTLRVTRNESSYSFCSRFDSSARVEGGDSEEVVKESEELDADRGGVGNQSDFGFNVTSRRPEWGELAPDEVALDVSFSPRVVNESGSPFSTS